MKITFLKICSGCKRHWYTMILYWKLQGKTAAGFIITCFVAKIVANTNILVMCVGHNYVKAPLIFLAIES